MNTAEKLREASLEVLRDLERSVKTSVTPERVFACLRPWVQRAEFEAVLSKADFMAAFIPSPVLSVVAPCRHDQALVWVMEALRAQGLEADLLVSGEVQIRWMKD